MPKRLKSRYISWKEIFWKKAVAMIAACYAVLGFWDLIKSEFLPESYQSLTVVKMTPHLSWRTWLIGLLALVILVLLEGAHAAIQKRERLIADLQPGTLAEHDPKIYLDPVNDGFMSSGLLPFELSNRGQRVNVAHKITIHPIEALPSIFFDYVDHLDMAEKKTMTPKVRGENLFRVGIFCVS